MKIKSTDLTTAVITDLTTTEYTESEGTSDGMAISTLLLIKDTSLQN